MAKSAPLLAALLAAALTASAFAADDPTPPKAPALPPDSTTDGLITLGGQKVAYQAVAGTITVGGTDEQDAQLGPDGNALPRAGNHHVSSDLQFTTVFPILFT